MLPLWDPARLTRKIPFNLALCGGRRQGKSTALADLLERNKHKFGLIIAFVGSAACNPVLEDPRFLWNDELITKLLLQQEALKRQGKNREVLLLIDDVILDGPARNQLENMAMRGRHFRISLACCAVSYVSLPKSVRRSLDCLLLFSCPMSGDLKILTWEYARRAQMARFALDNLRPYECLVLETLERRQELFNWRARNVTVDSLRNPASPSPARSEISASPASSAESPAEPRPPPTSATPDRTPAPAPAGPGSGGATPPDEASAPDATLP